MRQAHSDRPRLPTPAGLPARDAWVLQQIASLVGESCEALPPRHPASYERLIRQALATTDSATPAERPFVPQLQRWWAAGLVGVGLCAAASLLLLWRPTTSTTGNAVAGELRQGSIRVGDAPIVAGDDVPAGPPLSSDEGAELQLEDADITLAMHTTIRWERHRRLVRLERGQVDVSVKPPFGESFRVATPRFTVEVTGTRFAVDLRSVRVHEGSVRVRDRTGALIAEHIRAGEHWDWEQTPTASANPNAGDKVDWPAPAGARQGAEVMPVPGETTAPAASRPVSGADRHAFKARPAAQARKTKSRPPRDKTAASPGAAPSPRSDIGRSLKAAAQALRRGDFTAARAAVMRVLTLGPSPRERARAESVLAAVDARQGHTAAAIRRYATLAARYANTATGEDALFQAAALSLKAGQRGHAKELLGRYLARYPRGRRRAVVEQRLRSLRR